MNKQTIWDPAGFEMDPLALAGEQTYLENKYAEQALQPDEPRRKLIHRLMLGAIVAVVLILVFRSLDLRFVVLIGIACFTPAGIHYYAVRELENDLIKSMTAKRLGWYYSPTKNTDRWRRLSHIYPEVFAKGTRSQHVTDEFWGAYAGRFVESPFWIGEFEYTSQHGKSSSTYQELVFAVRLREPIATELIILPEDGASRFLSAFGGKDINLESSEFNRLFQITYNRPEAKKELKIYGVLNPAVMATLIDFRQASGSFEAIFRNNVLIVSFPHKTLRPKYTSFFKKVALDQRDADTITSYLDQILEFANKVIQQLD